MNTASERLKYARISAGYSSAGDFANAHGFATVTYRSHESGVRNFKVQSAQAYAAAIGLPHPSGWRWLMFGEEQENVFLSMPYKKNYVLNLSDSNDSYAALPENDDGFLKIPFFSEISAAAGDGALPLDGTPSDYIIFSHSMLSSICTIGPESLAGISVHGDSMEPTLNHGDQILLDLTIQAPKNDGIYVIRLDNTLLVKRLSIDPFRRQASVHSDNSIYPSIAGLSLDKIEVVGKVIWLGRRL